MYTSASRILHPFRKLCSPYKHLKASPTASSNSRCSYSSDAATNHKKEQTDRKDDNLFDVVIVGGGIVGVNTARALLIDRPTLRVAILEKEYDVGLHQSSHNSGVIHAGIYYQPDSLKAKLCVHGLHAMYAFCDKHNIPHKKCGKLIVAVHPRELRILKLLYNNALENKSPDVRIVEPAEIRQIEPHCRGILGIYSPHTGIVDYSVVTKYVAEDFRKRGGVLYCNFSVNKIEECEHGTEETNVSEAPVQFTNQNDGQTIRSRFGILCPGLYSDKVAEMASGLPEPVIIPFRGEYLELKEEKRHLIKGNIYPVPNPALPFLGVHFTPRLDGRILMGPNAVLAFGRECYSWKHINWKETREMFGHFAFRSLLLKYSISGAKEMFRSFFPSSQIRNLQAYIPEITVDDIVYNGFTGVRAQAVDFDGSLVDDLVLQMGYKGIEKKVLYLRNAPSPAATSSLALGEYIAKEAQVELEL